jgi:histidine triad (HIT) family protein
MRKKRPCVFCQISAGELPASIVYDDQDFMVIMDAYPLSRGHILILPKTHQQYLKELSETQQHRLFELGTALMQASEKAGFGSGDSNLLLNDGRNANQTVPHLHLHIIPRTKNDFLKNLPKLVLHITGVFGIQTKRATLDEQARKIRECLEPFD